MIPLAATAARMSRGRRVEIADDETFLSPLPHRPQTPSFHGIEEFPNQPRSLACLLGRPPVMSRMTISDPPLPANLGSAGSTPGPEEFADFFFARHKKTCTFIDTALIVASAFCLPVGRDVCTSSPTEYARISSREESSHPQAVTLTSMIALPGITDHDRF